MPIVSSEIKLYKSTNGLGGAITGNVIATGVLNNLFDDVTSAESSAGDTEYRCFYVKNENASIGLENTKVFISSNTPSTSTKIQIALATEAINTSVASIADETTAPTAITFTDTPVSNATGLSIGTLPAGGYKAVWVKRIVTAGATAAATDGCTFTIQGDTTV